MWISILGATSFSQAEAIARPIIDRYVEGEIDAVYVAYTEFKSAMTQNIVVKRLLTS